MECGGSDGWRRGERRGEARSWFAIDRAPEDPGGDGRRRFTPRKQKTERERENVGTCRNFEHQNERSMERETERERDREREEGRGEKDPVELHIFPGKLYDIDMQQLDDILSLPVYRKGRIHSRTNPLKFYCDSNTH